MATDRLAGVFRMGLDGAQAGVEDLRVIGNRAADPPASLGLVCIHADRCFDLKCYFVAHRTLESERRGRLGLGRVLQTSLSTCVAQIPIHTRQGTA